MFPSYRMNEENGVNEENGFQYYKNHKTIDAEWRDLHLKPE